MRVLGVIPARGGSKGIPGKNTRPLAGRPLIQYTIEVAARARRLTDWLVSTDDEEIAELARNLGAPVPFLRPAELATDTAAAIPVLQHAVRSMEAARASRYDAVMMLQPTTPFRTEHDIDGAIERLVHTGADSVISVVDVEGCHPARTKYLDGDRLLDPAFCESHENQPRQELTPMVIRNGAIYLTRRDILMDQGSLKGADSRALIMPRERSVNIDTLDDFAYAEWIGSRRTSAAVEPEQVPR
jgi:CMP-N,N'-diacetyllegionaminic acid synthase